MEKCETTDVAAFNQMGERKLFTLPTSVVEELRKDQLTQQEDI